jgi:hypothetical protein
MNQKDRENCEKKDKYDTREQAELAARVQMQQFVTGKIYVYQCPVCSLWHFTSKPPREDE